MTVSIEELRRASLVTLGSERLAAALVRRFDGRSEWLAPLARMIELTRSGHTHVREDELSADTGISEQVIAEMLSWFAGKVRFSAGTERQSASATSGARRPLAQSVMGGIFFSETIELEEDVARILIELADGVDPVAPPDRIRELLQPVLRGSRQPNAEQQRAIMLATQRRLSILTGGPGTGKTFTVAHILRALCLADENRRRVMLMAPTGKAARRMSEAVLAELDGLRLDESVMATLRQAGARASTIHRVLYGYGQADRDTGEQLHIVDADIVIVDEVSMVGLALFADLLRALPDNARLILIGDPRQLASVEAGTVLADIVEAASIDGEPAWTATGRALVGDDALPVSGTADESAIIEAAPLCNTLVRLVESRRFTADSDIGRLAAALERAEFALDEGRSALWSLLEARRGYDPSAADRPELVWIPAEADAAGTIDTIIEALYLSLLALCAAPDVDAAAQRLGDVALLAATRQGAFSVECFNQRIAQEMKAAGATWAPVMVIRNNYEQYVFNGELGIRVLDGTGVHIWFFEDDRTRTIPADELVLEDAFAMTIHKSQGSEYDHVWLVLPPLAGYGAATESQQRLLTRELLYTGLTRARRNLTIVAPAQTIDCMVEQRITRATGLVDRLRQQRAATHGENDGIDGAESTSDVSQADRPR